MLFRGIVPAVFTAFDEADKVSVAGAETMIERLLGEGVDGLFVCGSTGEWWLLDEAERRLMAEVAVRTAAGRCPVMIHVGANTTAEAIRLAQHAEAIGAQAISVLPPIGRPYPAAWVWRHFEAIGEACRLPMYLYHLPQIYGDQITIDGFLAALDRMPTLAGAKFSSYRIDDLIELKVKAGDRLNILSGCSEQLMSAVGAGADGSICTWYNLIPRLGRAIVDAMAANEVAAAQALQHTLVMFGRIMAGNAIANAKQLAVRRGIPVGPPRRPMWPADEAEFAQVIAKLTAEGYDRWLV